MEIHEKIRYMRLQKKLSQEQMSNKLGMSVFGYSKIERGESSVNINKLKKISMVLEIDLIELLNVGEKTISQHSACHKINNNCVVQDITSIKLELQKLELTIQCNERIIANKDHEINHLRDLLLLLTHATETRKISPDSTDHDSAI